MMGVGGENLARLAEVASGLLADAERIDGGIDELLDFLKPLRAQLNRCELAFATVAGKLSDAWLEDPLKGELTPIQHLRHECRMAPGAASAACVVGEQLQALPLSQVALDEGRIGFAHLTHLARTADFCGSGFKEKPLLRKAEKKNDVSTFARVCARARYQYCPEKFVEHERGLYEARFLEVSTRADDGAVFLNGFLDAESGAFVRTAIEGLSQKLPDDDRTAKQRRADALTEIARCALDEGRLPKHGGVRPHVQITATLETLMGVRGAPPAELEGSGPVSLEVLRRLAGDCSLRRILLSEDSLVIDVGRARRTFTRAGRLALENRDGGCVWPGCMRPARFTQADHEDPWFTGGETNAAKGRLLCLPHHRKREKGWQLARAKDPDDGTISWVVTPPGWTVTQGVPREFQYG